VVGRWLPHMRYAQYEESCKTGCTSRRGEYIYGYSEGEAGVVIPLLCSATLSHLI
jgi:hypothetical protein